MVNTNVVSPTNYWANSYINNAFVDGDDACMGIAPIGGQAFINGGNSIYGNGFPAGGIANQFGGGYGMGMMGYGPGSEVYGMSMKQYNNYQRDLTNQQLDNQLDYRHKTTATNFQASASHNALARQTGVLQGKILENEQDQVMREYDRCLHLAAKELVNSGYIKGNPDKEQVKAYFEQKYLETTGVSLTDQLKQSDHSPFTKGVMDGFGFGLGSQFTNKRTAGENYADITNTPVSNIEKTWQKVGWGTGAAITGGVSLAAILGIIKKIRA